METNFITVFTPTYNRAHTLPRTYESLLVQDCKDFIWLIVDDGSADSTAESDADACPDSPDTHAAALMQPDAQKNETGQRKRNRKPQLCQPDQQVHIFHSCLTIVQINPKCIIPENCQNFKTES